MNADGTISGKDTGTWKETDGTAYVTITMNSKEYKGVFTEQMITDKKQRTICFSAVSQAGRSIWGSKKQYGGSLMEAEPTPVPTPEPAATPEDSPAAEPTAAPEETPSIEPTQAPTDEPDDPGEDEEPASTVKVGKKATVKNLIYKVTSVKGIKAVQLTGVTASAKKNLTQASIPAQVKISGENYKVTSVAAKALKGCKQLKNLTVGKNVTGIGKEAFQNCGKLTRITLETKNLTKKSVGKNAFKGISKKANFLVPKDKVSTYAAIVKARGADKEVTVKKK